MLWLALTLLILGFVGASIWRRHLYQAKLLRLREISHTERMAAMERDLPVPQSDPSGVGALLGDDERTDTSRELVNGAGVRWIRFVALALGLTSLFGGLGALPGLYYQADQEASGMWPIGLIPVMVGVGLLIFVLLSRGLAEQLGGKQG
jgi:hypothetical protein